MNSSPLKQLFFVFLGLLATSALLWQLTKEPKPAPLEQNTPQSDSPNLKEQEENLYPLQVSLSFSHAPQIVELSSAQDSQTWKAPFPTPLSFGLLASKQETKGTSYLELELFCQWESLPPADSAQEITLHFSSPRFSAPVTLKLSCKETILMQTLSLPLPPNVQQAQP